MKKEKKTKIMGYEARPVTAKDTHEWCVKLQKPCNSDAPNGYVIKIPHYYEDMEIVIYSIIKKKVEGEELLLQVSTNTPIRNYKIIKNTLKRV